MARRWTFEQVVIYAKERGVLVERYRRSEYHSWREGEDHTTGVTYNISDLLLDIEDFAQKDLTKP